MKALVQKDLRENLKVALIGLLIFSLLLLHAYQSCVETVTQLIQGTWSDSWQTNDPQPLLSHNLLMEVAFFCGIFGAALGWLQTRNEAHRDLWAFLVHRPVTRTEIFWGKTLAGIGLYLVGAGLPLLVLVAVVRIPGHIPAPFEWEMVVPLAIIFLTGVAYYFAGLLTGLRQARWYGSRVFGLGLAMIASLALLAVDQQPWVKLLWVGVAIVILATASWGACQTGGFNRRQPVVGKLALFITLTVGCCVVFVVGSVLLDNLAMAPFSHRSFEYTYYHVTKEGTICRVTTRDGEVDAVDLDGHPLVDPKTGQKLSKNEVSRRFAYGPTLENSFKFRPKSYDLYRSAGHFFMLVNVIDKTFWYLDRHGKLTGYDGPTGRFIGNLDPPGAGGAASTGLYLWHSNPYNYFDAYEAMPQRLLATATTVYQIDFQDHGVKPVFTVPENEAISVSVENRSFEDNQYIYHFFFATHRTIYLLDHAGQRIFTVPYQPDDVDYPTLQLFALNPTNNFALWFRPDDKLNEQSGWKMPVHAIWLGPDVAAQKSVDLPHIFEPDRASWQDTLDNIILPPIGHAMVKSMEESNDSNHRILISLPLAVVCALIGWLLALRHQVPLAGRLGWSLFIILLGIPGLLTLLCLQEWPLRLACPHCQKRRAVDRAVCEFCQSPFSPPEKNGTEIFAPLTKAEGP